MDVGIGRRLLSYIIDNVCAIFCSIFLALSMIFLALMTHVMVFPDISLDFYSEKEYMVKIINKYTTNNYENPHRTIITTSESDEIICILLYLTDEEDIKKANAENTYYMKDKGITVERINLAREVGKYLVRDIILFGIIIILASLIGFILYYDVFGYFSKKQTIGRRIMSIALVDNSGKNVKAAQLFFRDFIGFYLTRPLNLLFGITTIINLILFVNHKKTFGDIISNTKMIKCYKPIKKLEARNSPYSCLYEND